MRNGPPYPLDKKTSAKVKAGKGEKRNDSFNVGSQHTASRTYQGSYTVPNHVLNEVGGWDNFFKKDNQFKNSYKDNDNDLKFEIRDGKTLPNLMMLKK